VILLDYRARYSHLDADKYLLWKDHGISTSDNDGEVNEVDRVRFHRHRVLPRAEQCRRRQPPVLAHFHEWMAASRAAHRAPASCRSRRSSRRTPRCSGRYLASDSPDFTTTCRSSTPTSRRASTTSGRATRSSAPRPHASTVFTTVSEVHGVRGRAPPGPQAGRHPAQRLNIRVSPRSTSSRTCTAQYKERIHDFVMGHFFPSYTFDLDNTLYFFTSGRYEYRNKGMDLFIEAMAR
jgi:glycogen(starch) synthase